MSTTNTTSEFLFLFRGGDKDRSMSPTELQKTMSSLLAWFDRLTAEGIAIGAHPLVEEARTVSIRDGRPVTDGPFAESKEAVGGYLLFRAPGFDEAVAIARGCPMLQFGTTIEIRQIAAECPAFQKAKAEMAGELAETAA